MIPCGRLFSVFVFLFVSLAMPQTGVAQSSFLLNDTGIVRCSNGVNWINCAETSDDDGMYPRQDGRFGRDNAVAAGIVNKIGKGAGGFDYTKICNNGLQEGEGDCRAAVQNFPGSAPDDWGCNRDNVTGLLWKVQIEEQIDWYRAAAADYPPATTARIGRLCGSIGWRLPERHELVSIVYNGRSKAPYIDTVYFPSTPESDVPALFWSSHELFADVAWYVYFGFGGSGVRDKADALSVRLVSGTRTPVKFIAKGDGTVFDSMTGLTWDRCALGQSGDGCSGSPLYKTWREALVSVVEANRSNHKGYSDWRLPNKNELESLVDLNRMEPAIDTEFFPQTPGVYFWSGTPAVAFGPASTWSILFSLGAIGIELQDNYYPVRLVRGGGVYASFDSAGVNHSKLDVSAISGNSAALSITVDRSATGSFLVLPAGMPMPTIDRIVTSGQSHAFVANIPQQFKLDGLFSGGDYRIWFVARVNGNFSNIVQKHFATRGNGSGNDVSVCIVGKEATLGTDCVNRVSAGTTPSFCLPSSGTVTLDIEGVRYTLTAQTEDTCFEIVTVDSGFRVPLLRQGSAIIGALYPDTMLLAARNGDIVRTDGNNSRIFARTDSVCTSTRISVEAGKISAPAWMTHPHSGGGCAADALTPPRPHYVLNDGALDCPATVFSIRGIYRSLNLTGTLSFKADQQVFYVAYIPATESNAEMWFQATRNHGWLPFGAPFEPFDSTSDSGVRELTLLSQLDVSGLPANTELYLGFGNNAEEMMINKRYCGFFTLAK